MSTTLLFAELLIIGLQATIWLSLIVVNIWGYKWLSALQAVGLSDWQTVIVVLALSFVYVLGIIIDRVADLIFSGWDKRIREKIIPNAPLPIAVMRFELGKDNEYLNRQFEYTRSRMRIARASSVNFSLITLLAIQFVLLHLQGNPGQIGYLIFLSVFGSFLVCTTLYSWYKLERTYFGLVRANYELYVSKPKTTPANSKATDELQEGAG
jgi:hypothetical protein